MEEGDATWLETHTPQVRLKAIFFEVPIGAAQAAHTNQRAVCHSVPFALAPQALIAQLVCGPVPRAVNCLLDATDMSRIERRRGGGECVRDVVTEVAVGIGAGKTV